MSFQSSTILPLEMRAASISWSTSAVSCESWRSITCSGCVSSAFCPWRRRRISRLVRSGASGFLSSWLSRARKRSFSRPSLRSVSWTRFSSLMSRKIAETPIRPPPASLSADIATDTASGTPARVTLTASYGGTASPFSTRWWTSCTCGISSGGTIRLIGRPIASSAV